MRAFDPEAATLDRRAFSDPAIHAQEIDRIFATAWLFVGPANWLAHPGDWISARLGSEPVLIWRDGAGSLQGFRDVCPRCDSPLSTGERGSATTIVCRRHPHQTDLAPVPHLAQHQGLIFATLDPDALPFQPSPIATAPLTAVGEHRLRWAFAGNWKLAMEHFCGSIDGGDWIHAATRLPRGAPLAQFPNLSFHRETSTLQVWHPTAPNRTEVDTWCMVAADATARQRDAARRATQRAWGPAGLLAQDLALHWQSVTDGSQGLLARRHPLPLHQEAGQRAFYAWWQHHLTALNARPRRAMPLILRTS